ncbi:MAG TPA: hypothetical protein VLA56_03705 [Pseudomonadales bacterium]|nr:hypothetical protein [Pseudomonadales bacterium]
MSLMELGALGEFFGAIAVFATLLFLAMQVRFARRAAEDTSVVMRSQGMREILLMLSGDADLNRLYARWLAADEASVLDAYAQRDEGVIRFVNLCLSALVTLQSSWLTDRSSHGRELTASRLRWQLQQPGCRAVWQMFRDVHFYDAFRMEVDRMCAELRLDPPAALANSRAA